MTKPYWTDDAVTLHLGDCLEVLAGMETASVDAIVTDPPAAVSFMGREWDSDMGGRAQWVAWLSERMAQAVRVLRPGGHALVWSLPRTAHWTAWALEDAGLEIRDCIPHLFGSGFPKSLDVGKAIDRSRNDRADILRITSWLADIAESGGVTRAMVDGHMGTSDMGGWWLSRLEHRCAVPTWDQWLALRRLLGFGDEMDAEVWRLNGRKGTPGETWSQREVVGSGKSGAAAVAYVRGAAAEYDVTAPATEDAARWDGWGTALKPGQELWWLARKPIRGTVAANVLEHGTGALNISGCRVGTEARINNAGGSSSLQRVSRVEHGYRPNVTASVGEASEVAGRWPPNLVLTHSAACDARCAGDCPVAELDRQSGSAPPSWRKGCGPTPDDRAAYAAMGAARPEFGYADTGGASRFYPVFRYQAKAPASERPRGEDGSAHPTVKSLPLMQWLCRLITPPGGTVLDLFAGSGPTAEACIIEGFRCILIERDPASAELIRIRLRKDIQPSMFA